MGDIDNVSPVTPASRPPRWQQVRGFIIALAVLELVIVAIMVIIWTLIALEGMLRPPHAFTFPPDNGFWFLLALTIVAIGVVIWATVQSQRERSARQGKP